MILRREDGARTKWYISSIEWLDFLTGITDDISFLSSKDNDKLRETLCGKVIETYSKGNYLMCISTVGPKESLLAKCEEYLRRKNNY